jgi:hypothetical protein
VSHSTPKLPQVTTITPRGREIVITIVIEKVCCNSNFSVGVDEGSQHLELQMDTKDQVREIDKHIFTSRSNLVMQTSY